MRLPVLLPGDRPDFHCYQVKQHPLQSHVSHLPASDSHPGKGLQDHLLQKTWREPGRPKQVPSPQPQRGLLHIRRWLSRLTRLLPGNRWGCHRCCWVEQLSSQAHHVSQH